MPNSITTVAPISDRRIEPAATATKVAVLVVAWNNAKDLQVCLQSLRNDDSAQISRFIVVLNNGSNAEIEALIVKEFPHVTLINSVTNLGYAEGVNAAWKEAHRVIPNVDYIAVLNQDTAVTQGWLDPLIQHLEANPDVACVQPAIVLMSDPTRVNTLGNISHYLGFGFVTGFGSSTSDIPKSPTAIGYASGAAFLTRATVVRQLGFFEEFLFLYHEDTAFGWKLRQCGYGIELVPASRVAHCYDAPKGVQHYYWLERNRLIILFCFLRLRTLLLLSPALTLMEAGQFMFSLQHGLVLTRLRIWYWFLRPANLARLRTCRTTQQSRRTQTDRDFTCQFTATLDESLLGSQWLIATANRVLSAWWYLIRRLIMW